MSKEILNSVARLEGAKGYVSKALEELCELNLRMSADEIIRKVRYVESLLLDPAHARIQFEMEEIRRLTTAKRVIPQGEE